MRLRKANEKRLTAYLVECYERKHDSRASTFSAGLVGWMDISGGYGGPAFLERHLGKRKAERVGKLYSELRRSGQWQRLMQHARMRVKYEAMKSNPAQHRHYLENARLHQVSAKHCGDKCELCRGTDRLVVHHYDGWPEHNDPDNLVTLCATCHQRLHGEDGILRYAPCRSERAKVLPPSAARMRIAGALLLLPKRLSKKNRRRVLGALAAYLKAHPNFRRSGDTILN